MNVQHSSKDDRWYTPVPIVEAARIVLGPIDLDPASDLFGNSRVRAARFYTEHDDGLSQTWAGIIFLNPPGGVQVDPRGTSKKTVSRPGLFWRELMTTRDAGRLSHAIYVAFSLEQISNTQAKGCASCADFTVCIPSKRLRFDRPGGLPGAAPSHANAIVYVPGSVDRTAKFVEAFAGIGAVLQPATVGRAA